MDVPNFLKRIFLKERNCLKHALYANDLPDDWRVAQGYIPLLDTGLRCQHCWLESPTTVADLLRRPNRFFEREDYYREFDPIEVEYRTPSEVRKLMIKKGYIEFWIPPWIPPKFRARYKAWVAKAQAELEARTKLKKKSPAPATKKKSPAPAVKKKKSPRRRT